MDLKNFLSKIRFLPKEIIRKQYNSIKRSRLKNHSPTIISRNCIGGIIYHDLGLKFTSPTVNISMDNADFITFIENLELLTRNDAVLTEISVEDCNYPVGLLCNGEISVRIEFVHYKSFKEAKLKWFERTSRMNYQNIYIIWEYAKKDGPDQELWLRYKSLKYQKKILITGNCFPIKDKDVFYTDLYNQNYKYGKILEYKNGCKFYKRYLDDFDYVSFLNNNI